jgi:hypothetical protein
LDVSIPFLTKGASQRCDATIHFARNPNAAVDPATFKSYSSGSLRFGFGGTMARSGGQKDVATGNFNFDLTVQGYGRHAFGLAFILQVESTGGNPALMAPATGSPGTDPGLTTAHVGFGLSLRHFLHDDWPLQYDLAPTVALFSYNTAGQANKVTTGYLAFMQRLSLSYQYYRKRVGFWRGDYGIGASLYHFWYPGYVEPGGVGLSGNTLGLLGFLSFGF